MTTGIDLGRPTSGDVLDLITDDHRRFELLLTQLRLSIIAPARSDVSDQVRRELGEK